jgi:alpha-1,3-fucosyltransferase
MGGVLPRISCTFWKQLGAGHKCLTGVPDDGTPAHVVLHGRTPHFQNSSATIVRNKTGLKRIVFWTPYWGSATWDYSSLGTTPFEHELCRFRCYATNSRAALSEADAVVFHYDDFDRKWPSKLTEDIISVLVVHEPPSLVGDKIRMFDDKIHFVMSYRKDSDFYSPYRVIRPTNVENATAYTPRVPLKDRPKSVVWVASNCAAWSHRELYVKELAKYIDVDIYGKCGTLSCPKEQWGNCLNMFESTYKFYLSFENSLCKDYVTEKLYEPLRRDIVPVVMGGSDFKLEDPPGSDAVINVRDFASPKELAAYLNKLSKDEAAYNKFFEKKKQYRVLNTHGPLTLGFCALCDWLSSRDVHRSWPRRKDLVNWWYKDTCHNEFIPEQRLHW